MPVVVTLLVDVVAVLLVVVSSSFKTRSFLLWFGPETAPKQAEIHLNRPLSHETRQGSVPVMLLVTVLVRLEVPVTEVPAKHVSII